MAVYKQLSSLYLKLISKVGEGTPAGDIIDNIRLNAVTRFTLLAKLNNKLCASANNISYQMGMYAPDHFSVDITLSMSDNHVISSLRDENDNQLTLTRIASALQGLRAEVRYLSESGNDVALSENLFVYQATPSIDRVEGVSSMRVTLQIYSVDKLLELQKFSQAFTGMPLGNIITDDNMKPFFPSKNGSAMYEFKTAKNLHVLGYRHTNGSNCELIQSYMAQYNETFRELLNRTANRCGEFLYWRKGQLQYGLANKENSINVDDDAARITVPELPTTDFEALNVFETHRNGNEAPEITTKEESIKIDETHKMVAITSEVTPEVNHVRYDQEVGMPDFNDTVKFVYGNKRKYDYKRLFLTGMGNVYYTDTTDKNYGKKNEAKSDDLKYWIGKFLSKFASSGGILQFLSGIAVDSVITMPLVKMELEKFKDVLDNGSHNKRFSSLRTGDMACFNKAEQANFQFEKDGITPKIKANSPGEYDKVNSINKVAPFTTIKDVVDLNNNFLESDMLGNVFYTKVRKLGETAAKNAVDIVMTPNAKPLNVGQHIQLNGVEYIVTSIAGSSSQSDIDGYAAAGDTIVTTQKVHAIPQSKIKENVFFFIPEPLLVQTRKMDGNSTAYITDIEDPYKEGRVRVRFTWQGAHPSVTSPKVAFTEEDSTPWIRMTMPAAGNAINYMKPCIGDEVIVGFENGNLERPYVIGSVFNKSKNLPVTTPLTASNTGCYYLKMPNGESISMVDENISPSDVLGQFLSPLVGSVMKLADMDYKNSFHQLKYKVGGKIEMKDKYGFYNVSMSSAERAVKIACPLGNISLSAFSGINISAPNGDININGKNVNITAGDKITLTSGMNKGILDTTLRKATSDFAGTLVQMVASAGVAAANVLMGDIRVVDLSMARSIAEVMFRPINGTLSLHSCHHLLIEAGYGNVEMPMDSVAAKSAKSAIATIPNYPYYLLENFVDGIEGDFQNGVVALQNVYDWIRNYTPRDNQPLLDLHEDGVLSYLDYVSSKHNGIDSVLSLNKFNQILQKGTKKKGKIWVVDDSESTINAYCPILVKLIEFPDYKNWVAEVKKVAQKVADLQNIHEAIVSKKVEDMPALKSLIEAMEASLFKNKAGLVSFLTSKSIKEKDFKELSDFSSKVKYDEKGNDGRRNVDFDITNFVGGTVTRDNYKPITFTGSFTEDHRHLIQFVILKVLHKAGVIKYIDSSETIVFGQKQYTLSDFPAWNGGKPGNFDKWNEFLSHCAPSDSVSEKSALKSFRSSLAKSAVSAGDTVLNSFDLYNQVQTINEAWNNDTKLWNTTSHPGMILMSSDFGSSTAVVDSTGRIVANNNHSVYSVLDNMKQQEALPQDVNREDSIQAAFERDWTQTFNV